MVLELTKLDLTDLDVLDVHLTDYDCWVGYCWIWTRWSRDQSIELDGRRANKAGANEALCKVA